MVHIIEDLAGDWRRFDERIKAVSTEIEELARADEGAVRLMSVPGIGPIISSATVAGIGKGDVFGKGRDFGAWLGLVLGRFCRRRSRPIVTERAYSDSALHQVESPQKPTSDRLRHDVHSNGRRLCPRSEASRRRSAFVHKSAGLGCGAGVPWPLHIPLAAPTCALLVRCRRMLRRAMLGVGSSY